MHTYIYIYIYILFLPFWGTPDIGCWGLPVGQKSEKKKVTGNRTPPPYKKRRLQPYPPP